MKPEIVMWLAGALVITTRHAVVGGAWLAAAFRSSGSTASWGKNVLRRHHAFLRGGTHLAVAAGLVVCSIVFVTGGNLLFWAILAPVTLSSTAEVVDDRTGQRFLMRPAEGAPTH